MLKSILFGLVLSIILVNANQNFNGQVGKKSNRVNLLTQAISSRLLSQNARSSVMGLQPHEMSGQTQFQQPGQQFMSMSGRSQSLNNQNQMQRMSPDVDTSNLITADTIQQPIMRSNMRSIGQTDGMQSMQSVQSNPRQSVQSFNRFEAPRVDIQVNTDKNGRLIDNSMMRQMEQPVEDVQTVPTPFFTPAPPNSFRQTQRESNIPQMVRFLPNGQIETTIARPTERPIEQQVTTPAPFLTTSTDAFIPQLPPMQQQQQQQPVQPQQQQMVRFVNGRFETATFTTVATPINTVTAPSSFNSFTTPSSFNSFTTPSSFNSFTTPSSIQLPPDFNNLNPIFQKQVLEQQRISQQFAQQIASLQKQQTAGVQGLQPQQQFIPTTTTSTTTNTPVQLMQNQFGPRIGLNNQMDSSLQFNQMNPFNQRQIMPVTPAMPTGGSDDFCRARQPGDLIPHPSNNNQFIICYGPGDFTIMDCPEHLVYNSHTERCDNEAIQPQGCASNPCMNGGKCVDMPRFDFRCECPTGFSGLQCDKRDSCGTNPCGGDGQCLTLQSGHPISHVCLCQGGRAIGQTCQSVEMNPCTQPNSNLRLFSLSMNPSMFVQCEGIKPHIKFCNFPLIFSATKQMCDWN